MKTQVKEITQTIELLNMKPEKRKSYIALLTISIICFILMTAAGVLFAMTEKTVDNQLLYTIYFGITAGFAGLLFFCLIGRTALTYKFKWTVVGAWNLIINVITICLILSLVALYAIDYFELINLNTTMSETNPIIEICFLAMVIVYTILLFLAICFMSGFDFVYLMEGHYAPSLITRRNIIKSRKAQKAANRVTKSNNRKNSRGTSNVKLNRSEKKALAAKKREAKIMQKQALSNKKHESKRVEKEAIAAKKREAKIEQKQALSNKKHEAKRAEKEAIAAKKREAKIEQKQVLANEKNEAKRAKKEAIAAKNREAKIEQKQVLANEKIEANRERKEELAARNRETKITQKKTLAAKKQKAIKKEVVAKPIDKKEQQVAKKTTETKTIKKTIVAKKAKPVVAKKAKPVVAKKAKPVVAKKAKTVIEKQIVTKIEVQKPAVQKPIVLNDQQVIITFDKKLGVDKINEKIKGIEKSLGTNKSKSSKSTGIKIEKETLK